MFELKNDHIVDLIKKILDDPGDTIPYDLSDELIEYLSDAKFLCPSDGKGGIVHLGIGPNSFLPACCDIEDFNRIFDDCEPEVFSFKDFSSFFKSDMDGVIVNPGSFGFIVNPALSDMVFNKIKSENRAPTTKGYDVKVRLNDFRPLTWRDLIIPENITFTELDDILKTLWGFEGYHLSQFMIRKDRLSIMDRKLADESMMGCDFDSDTTLINELFDKYNKITYWYDFGDDWEFDIEIKGKVDYDKDYVTIKRFKGKYNPIEDCNGVYGLSEIIYYAENPDEKDSSQFSELSDYLEEFDMEYVQNLLKHKHYVKSMWKE